MTAARRPDPVVIALVVVGTALAGWLAFVVLRARADRPADEGRIGYRVTGVTVGDPRQIEVTFEVTKPATLRVSCQVAAFTENGFSAGRLNGVTVPARDDGVRTTSHTVVVPTPEGAAERAAISQCVPVDSAG